MHIASAPLHFMGLMKVIKRISSASKMTIAGEECPRNFLSQILVQMFLYRELQTYSWQVPIEVIYIVHFIYLFISHYNWEVELLYTYQNVCFRCWWPNNSLHLRFRRHQILRWKDSITLSFHWTITIHIVVPEGT